MSDDPTRLADDPNERAALRDDLAAASSTSAFEYDLDRGLAELRSAVRGGGQGGGGSTSIAGGWKGIALALVSVAGIGGIAWWLAREEPTAPANEAREPAPTVSLEATPTPTSPGGTPTPAAEVDEPSPSVSDEVEGRGPSAGEPVRRARPVAGTYPDEVTFVARARAALPIDAGRALALAEEGLRRHRDGVLREELEAIRILALARLGRTGEARLRAARFLSASPDHPMAAHVRGAVEGPP